MNRSPEDMMQLAENELSAYETAHARWADLCRDEMRLEAQRPGILDAVTSRLIGTDNALTARPHSATSAAEAARSSTEYLEHLSNQRNTVHAKNRAEGDYQSAFLRAHLALAQLKATAGVL